VGSGSAGGIGELPAVGRRLPLSFVDGAEWVVQAMGVRRPDVFDVPRSPPLRVHDLPARAPDAVFTVRTYATGRHDRTSPLSARPPTQHPRSQPYQPQNQRIVAQVGLQGIYHAVRDSAGATGSQSVRGDAAPTGLQSACRGWCKTPMPRSSIGGHPGIHQARPLVGLGRPGCVS